MNVRLPPRLSSQGVLSFFYGRGVIGCDVLDRSEAVEVDAKNAVVSALCAGIREQRQRPALLRKLGTSDLNLAAPAWGCPSAAYGPGDSHLDHTDFESLPLVDFQRAIGVLAVSFSLFAHSGPVKIHASSRPTI